VFPLFYVDYLEHSLMTEIVVSFQNNQQGIFSFAMEMLSHHFDVRNSGQHFIHGKNYIKVGNRDKN
jgi:hypothetical protein